MGITAGPSYVTEQGFVVSPVYLSLTSYRFQRVPDGKFQSVFTVQAYKSREDKAAGRAPLNLPGYLANAECILQYADFYRKSIFALGYDAAKAAWQAAGFVVEDILEPGQPGPSEYIYNSSGFDIDGFNAAGFNADGFDREGFNVDGYDRDGYGRDGFNAQGYDRQGYGRDGFDVEGYDRYNFDREGYDRAGFNREGYDREGYNAQGYNAEGLDRDGNPRPPTDISGSTVSPSTDLSGNAPPSAEPAPEAP